MKLKKLDRKTTALVKDLELQLDYLTGYAPSGLQWKQEYKMRCQMMDATLCDEQTPKEIIEKIHRIQDALYNLRSDIKHEQGYITYSEIDYAMERKILVNDRRNNTSYYI